MPPFLDGQSSVNVTLFFTPGGILSLDSINQIFMFTGPFTLIWTDLSLAWNKSLHDVHVISIDPTPIWIPEIFLLNAEGNTRISLPSHPSVYVTHNGTVVMVMRDKFRTICVTDAFDFPFDEQNCELNLIPVEAFVNLSATLTRNPVLSSILMKKSEWVLKNVTNKNIYIDGFEIKSVTLTLKRQSLFYVLSIIIPMALTSIMNAFVFILPADSGEKVSFLVSIFVSHAVFLNFVYDIMPRTSTRVPKIMIYLICILLQSFLSLLAVITTLRIRNNKVQGDHKRVSTVVDQTVGDCSTGMSKMKDRLHNLDSQKLDSILFVVSLFIAILNTIVLIT
ncbi:5-hydroxytryptamine receptor 3A-like [Haliotis asinina]|uniref:5-hydroxytryptamine receptor 3A-like n=1 Tax=Haliotis asinina TaxID=109174 RepID=UPI003531A8DA